MKKVTVMLDEKTAAWVRKSAAEKGKSVSCFVRELMRMRALRDYNRAMCHYLAMKPFSFRWAEGQKTSREVLNERARSTRAGNEH